MFSNHKFKAVSFTVNDIKTDGRWRQTQVKTHHASSNIILCELQLTISFFLEC